MNVKEVKPSVLTALLFALYALLIIPAMKFLLTKYHVNGLSELAQYI